MADVRLLVAGLLVLAALAAPAAAQTRLPEQTRVPESRGEIALSFAPLVKKAAPAVVNIYTRKVVRERLSPLFQDPFFNRFFGDALQGLQRDRVQNSLGSGVIVRDSGLVVTNSHVIDGADEITVVLSDRREFEATIAYADPRTDIAVLRMTGVAERLPVLDLRDSDEVEVGDLVLAIGNPFGVGQTVTQGIVSALARTSVGITDFNFFIQTDAAINPGNSGGALVGLDGRLVGVNTAIYTRQQQGGSIGIGFAVPANMVRTVIEAAETGRLVRPWLGASGDTVTAEQAQALGLARPAGVIVTRVHPGSPADRAGLSVGDVVTHVNGRLLEDGQALRYRLATARVGDQARLTVERRGQRRELSVALVAPPEVPPREVTPIGGRSPFTGATVANLSPAYAEEIGFDGPPEGVVVVEVQRGAPAGRLGLQKGDVVLKVNGRDVARVADLRRLLSGGARQWQIAIRRGGRVLQVQVEG